MNGLVFGGLIALAVVALILLVVVLMSEQRSQSAAVSVDEAPAREATQATAALPATPAPVATPAPKRTVPVTQPVFEQERLAAFNHSQPLPETDSLALIRIRGQLREISSELRLLHKQSAAFEQRISALTEAANYVERMLAEQSSVEEAEESLS